MTTLLEPNEANLGLPDNDPTLPMPLVPATT